MPGYRRGWANRMKPGSDFSNLRSPLAVSFLEPALLLLIKENPRHGYTLLNDLESLGVKNLHPSVVYRVLREMEELAWINSKWDTSQTQGPPRRNYQITPQGESVLQNWKNELGKANEMILVLLERLSNLKGGEPDA